MSCTPSSTMASRMELAIFEEMRLMKVSLRLERQPMTISHSSPNRSSMAGMSAGSFWRSASMVTTMSESAASNPAQNAADCPLFSAKATNRTSPWASASRRMISRLSSVLQSSTNTASQGRPVESGGPLQLGEQRIQVVALVVDRQDHGKFISLVHRRIALRNLLGIVNRLPSRTVIPQSAIPSKKLFSSPGNKRLTNPAHPPRNTFSRDAGWSSW